MPKPVIIPLVNPNEPESLLAAIHVSQGQEVTAEDMICTLETTKSTADVVAEQTGFIVGLRFSVGDTVRAGEILCYIGENPDWQPENQDQAIQTGDDIAPPTDLRITQPALALARAYQVDLSQFSRDSLITESLVRSKIRSSELADVSATQVQMDPDRIFIYGGGGHGKAVLDLLRVLGEYQVVGFVDDGIPVDAQIMGLPVLGGREALQELYAQGVHQVVNAVGGIGNVDIRVKVFETLELLGFVCPPVVHPTAFVEPSAALSPGVQVFPYAYVGSEAKIGFGTIINTGAVVSHDCVLGAYVNVSPGAILAGEVVVGAKTLIGMGVTVNLRCELGLNAKIGNGATVKFDVPGGGIVRAGTVWPE